MFSGFDLQTRQMLIGNLLLIGCCVFYLIWWFVAFKPEGAVTGAKSGWLLIPAFILGILAIVQIVRGGCLSELPKVLMPRMAVVICGVAAYVILLIVSRITLKRPVTTELLLIVGWAVLAFLEVNALYGLDQFTKAAAIVFLVLIVAAAAIGIVCYLLYYGLDVRAGYIDGMVPLLLVAVMMAAVSITVLI